MWINLSTVREMLPEDHPFSWHEQQIYMIWIGTIWSTRWDWQQNIFQFLLVVLVFLFPIIKNGVLTCLGGERKEDGGLKNCFCEIWLAVAIVDSTIVENFGQEMKQARAELPALKGPQFIMLGHVGQSLPSQPVLAELGCCACFNRPPRQAYLRNALAVALAGIPTTLALPHCTLNTGKLQNLHFGPFSNPCLLFCKSHKRDYPLKLCWLLICSSGQPEQNTVLSLLQADTLKLLTYSAMCGLANGKEAVKGEDSPRSLTSASQSTVHKSRVLLVVRFLCFSDGTVSMCLINHLHPDP